jgi:hypothetical protein
MLRVEFTRGMELARLAVGEIRTVADDWIPTGVSLKHSADYYNKARSTPLKFL